MFHGKSPCLYCFWLSYYVISTCFDGFKLQMWWINCRLFNHIWLDPGFVCGICRTIWPLQPGLMTDHATICISIFLVIGHKKTHVYSNKTRGGCILMWTICHGTGISYFTNTTNTINNNTMKLVWKRPWHRTTWLRCASVVRASPSPADICRRWTTYCTCQKIRDKQHIFAPCPGLIWQEKQWFADNMHM